MFRIVHKKCGAFRLGDRGEAIDLLRLPGARLLHSISSGYLSLHLITPFYRLSHQNMKVVFAQVVALAVGASAFNGEIRTSGTPCRVRKNIVFY